MEYTVERFDARQWTEEQMDELFSEGFPQFIASDPIAKSYIKQVKRYFGEYHIILVNSEGQPVGSGWGVPIQWDGKITDLPSGYTDSIIRSVKGHDAQTPSNTFVICAGIVNPKFS